MADDIVGALRNLRLEFDSLARTIRTTGKVERRRIERSREAIKAGTLVANSNFLEAQRNTFKQARELVRAQREMRHSTGSWQTPQDYLKWESLMRSRRSRELAKRIRVADTIRRITDPKEQHRLDLVREYGNADAQRILDAERDNRHTEVQDTIRRIQHPELQHRLDLERRYGNADAQHILDAERDREIVDRRIRRNRAIRSSQINAYRKYPWVKSLVDSGIIQKKELPKISKRLDRISKSAIIGNIVRHPYAAIAGAAMGGLSMYSSFIQGQWKANESVAKLENTRMFYGDPNPEFMKAALGAGLDEVSARQMYGSIQDRFGPNISTAVNFIKSFQHLDPYLRRQVAKSEGIDDTTFSVLSAMSGIDIGASAEREHLRKQKMLESIQKYGKSEGQDTATKVISTVFDIPIIGTLEKEAVIDTMEQLEKLPPPPKGKPSMFNKLINRFMFGDQPALMEQIRASEEAAEAAASSSEASDKSGSSILNNTTSQNNSRRFDISNVYVTANNADELMESIEREASSISYDDMLSAADRMDSGALA